MSASGRLRRALLFMPGDDLKKISKGAASGVDSVIMDLEDGVALNRKAEARTITIQALQTLNFGKTERLVRVNPHGTPFHEADLAAILPARPDGIVLPKAESVTQIILVAEAIKQVEQANGWPVGSIRLIAIIESALGLIDLPNIAGRSSRLDALAFGAEDYTSSVGATRTRDGLEVLYARSAVVAHAAAFGLQAIDTPYVNLQDDDGLHADARFAATLGYTGKFAIHPKQIKPLEAAFNPTPDAIHYAARVLAANQARQDDGTGVFELDGKMIDMPMVRAAELILSKARAAGLLPES
jgi:citrate lyase beta subunit